MSNIVRLLGEGGSRKVYLLRSGNVLKIEKDVCIADNDVEARIYQLAREVGLQHRLAQCHLSSDGLVMEYVDTTAQCLGKKLPVWTRLIDNNQVGFSRKGVLVAYDYTNLLPQEPAVYFDGSRFSVKSEKEALEETLRLMQK